MPRQLSANDGPTRRAVLNPGHATCGQAAGRCAGSVFAPRPRSTAATRLRKGSGWTGRRTPPVRAPLPRSSGQDRSQAGGSPPAQPRMRQPGARVIRTLHPGCRAFDWRSSTAWQSVPIEVEGSLRSEVARSAGRARGCLDLPRPRLWRSRLSQIASSREIARLHTVCRRSVPSRGNAVADLSKLRSKLSRWSPMKSPRSVERTGRGQGSCTTLQQT